MGSIFEEPEPHILMQYYDRGEGFWQKVKRFIQNIFRHLSGDEPLDYDEYDEQDEFCAEWEGQFDD